MSTNNLLTFVTIVTILSGVLSYEKFFVDDASEHMEDGEATEVLLRKRSLRVKKVSRHTYLIEYMIMFPATLLNM